MNDWRPIRTAPKPGILCNVKRVYQNHIIAEGVAYFGDVTINYSDRPYTFHDVWIRHGESKLFPEPTHWKPLMG